MTPEQFDHLFLWMGSVSESLFEHRQEISRLEERILSLEIELDKKKYEENK